MRPTKISKPKKGSGARAGIKKEMTARRTSPAKILPKSRKAKEMILASSEMISRMPTKVLMGLLRLINFLKL